MILSTGNLSIFCSVRLLFLEHFNNKNCTFIRIRLSKVDCGRITLILLWQQECSLTDSYYTRKITPHSLLHITTSIPFGLYIQMQHQCMETTSMVDEEHDTESVLLLYSKSIEIKALGLRKKKL